MTYLRYVPDIERLAPDVQATTGGPHPGHDPGVATPLSRRCDPRVLGIAFNDYSTGDASLGLLISLSSTRLRMTGVS